MAILPSAPIAAFEEYADPKAADFLPIVEAATGKTKKIKASYFGQAAPSSNYKWTSAFSYAEDAIVEYNGKWYLSLQAANLGKVPNLEPTFWELQTKAPSGFVFWEAGVYTGDPVLVLYELNGVISIYILVNATRPFLSSDFEDELALGDWGITGAGVTREFHRTFSETLIFDKNEIEYAPHVADDDITFSLGAGNLVDQYSSITVPISFDGTQRINFNISNVRLYGITNGATPDAGNYEIYFLYSNGSVRVNFPGVTSQSSGAVTLSTPSNFAAVPGTDPETEIDLTWDDVSNESSYLIEVSETGTGGWSTLNTPAANVEDYTQTGLSANNIRYYRLKAIGDGANYLDSPYTAVISAQTESAGDVTDPTFTFLPANGNTTWTVNRPIVITANEPIRNADGTALTDANIAAVITLKQTNSGGANIAFTATIDGTKQIITITPTTIYGANQLVYVAINNVEDVNENDITVAVSVTFTTTEFTYLNGTSNRLIFGDILDSVFSANDAVFKLKATVNNLLLSGNRIFWAKHSISDSQRGFYWFTSGSDVYFSWFSTGSDLHGRSIKWTGVLADDNEHDMILEYDGSLDTSDGLNRAVFKIDGVTQGSKTMFNSFGTLGNIYSNNAQLAFGLPVNHAGTPVGVSYFSEEAKDIIIESAAAVVEINVPIVKTGTDTSGNARNGTWV